MANELRELQLQGDSTVYKLNDARITTTAVDTATHILTTNSAVSSIAPITAANLASVLGVPAPFYKDYQTFSALVSAIGNNLYLRTGDVPSGDTTINIGTGLLLVFANTSMNIYFLTYWVEGAANVVNNTFQQITVSKSSGSAYATIHNDNQGDVKYLMIGNPFTA